MSTRIVISDYGWKKLWTRFSLPNFVCSAYSEFSLKEEISRSNGVFVYLSSVRKPSSFCAAAGISILDNRTLKVHFYLFPVSSDRIAHLAMAKIFSGISRFGDQRSYRKVLVPCILDDLYENYHKLFSQYCCSYPDSFNQDIVWYEMERGHFEGLCSVE